MLVDALFITRILSAKIIVEAEPAVCGCSFPFPLVYTLRLLKHFPNWSVSCTCILSRLAYVVRDELFCAINMFTLRQTSCIFCAEIKENLFSVGSKQD